MVLEEPVQLAIWQSLNHYCYKDAVFLSERLFAEASSDETLLLLATSYYRSGMVKRAYALLQKHNPSNINCKYLMAKCCSDLKKYSEVEHLIVGGLGVVFNSKIIENITNEFGSLAAYVLQLLGNVYRKSDQSSKAAECFKASLKYNPFLWTSFECLCQMGEKVDPQDYFKTSTSNIVLPGDFPNNFTHRTPSDTKGNFHYDSLSSENMDPSHDHSAPLMTSTIVSKPAHNQRASTDTDMPPASGSQDQPRNRIGRNLLGATASNSPLTPSFGILPQDTPPAEGVDNDFITPPNPVANAMKMNAPMKKHATASKIKAGKKSTFTGILAGPSKLITSSTSSSLMTPSPTTSSRISNMGLRRSSRLFGSNSGGSKEETKKRTKVQFTEANNNPRKTRARRTRLSTTQPLTPSSDNNIQQSITPNQDMQEREKSDVKDEKSELPSIQSSAAGLMQLLQVIGKAYAALTSYDCKKAAALFESLPPHQLNTCWVLQHVGAAYFEIAEYHLGEKRFLELRRLDPYHMDGMVIFSTLLWHLKKEGSLSSIALELTELNRLSPEAWCAMGNCFSLQKEHDSAIKFLQRAIQLDPEFTYAYTLLGHEYVLTEELDKGMSCFRTSIRLDSRHYNAWYGMAMIYYKQENYQFAEKHFLRALQINPKNSVLLCHLAVTQNAMKKSLQALQTINKALNFMPKNALCKYHKSSFLYTLERYDEAINELEELRRIVPREALVYFLFGKIYRKRGQPDMAQMNFSWAMSLDPQGANNMIKEARYNKEDEDETDGDFNVGSVDNTDNMIDELMSN